ncbi:hypothetical protein F8388_020362 [Cannabis sativa]|uniref:Uncharacterized protein n=1 Tax=Cannabis sativa TaxID=3483 RepID=A0A7J6HGW5_CANSA|nr:hypothetical protein F8388_020362 [Cannabis sativa]
MIPSHWKFPEVPRHNDPNRQQYTPTHHVQNPMNLVADIVMYEDETSPVMSWTRNSALKSSTFEGRSSQPTLLLLIGLYCTITLPNANHGPGSNHLWPVSGVQAPRNPFYFCILVANPKYNVNFVLRRYFQPNSALKVGSVLQLVMRSYMHIYTLYTFVIVHNVWFKSRQMLSEKSLKLQDYRLQKVSTGQLGSSCTFAVKKTLAHLTFFVSGLCVGVQCHDYLQHRTREATDFLTFKNIGLLGSYIRSSASTVTSIAYNEQDESSCGDNVSTNVDCETNSFVNSSSSGNVNFNQNPNELSGDQPTIKE